ncbi:MAG: NAD(P)-dependent oxidoreductase [Nitrospirae bacterium]|nr:NAD(P)-dependent oxidoreductase [Nitrospirota bacterium]
MKVFLTGATGFVGSAVLKRLTAAGHTVKGLIQDAAKADMVKRAGGIPVHGDLLVPEPWADSVKDCELVISASSPFRVNEAMSIKDAERRSEAHKEMVTNLINATRYSRVEAILLTYHVTALGNHGDRWGSEVLTVDPVGLARPVGGAYWAIDKAAKKAGLPTIEVFPGWVYGPGGWFEHYIVDGIKAGTLRVMEAGVNYNSLIHIDDLAEGIKRIVDRMPLGERFCLADNHPVTQKTFLDYVAGLMGAAPPKTVDYNTFAKLHGELMAEAFGSSIRVSNVKARNEAGFAPMYQSYIEGVPEALRALGIELAPAEMKKAAGF